MGKPQVSVVALTSKAFDVYRLQDGLKNRGWSMNNLQFPSRLDSRLLKRHTKVGGNACLRINRASLFYSGF